MFIKTFKIRSKYLILSFAIFLIIILPIIVIPAIRNTPNTIGYLPNGETSDFLELWNIDTFEGGSSSRSVFLEKIAIDFENQNRGVYVIVKNLTKEQAQLQLEQGYEPDMVSFGIGAGDLFVDYLDELSSTYSVKSDLKNGGVYQGKQLAIPWCMGGYVLCSKNEVDTSKLLGNTENLIGFGQESTITLKALPSNTYAKSSIFASCLENYTQYQAYQDFLLNKFEILIGTQRDYFRLQNRISTGSLECNFSFLEEYSDLLQWIGVFKNDKEKTTVNAFIEFLLSPEQQKKLSRLGMFSTNGTKVYDDIEHQEYIEFEKSVNKITKTANAFLTYEEIKREQQNVLAKLFK